MLILLTYNSIEGSNRSGERTHTVTGTKIIRFTIFYLNPHLRFPEY